MQKQTKQSILFICTSNSCRSQMAEGWVRHLKGEILEPYSAGLEKRKLDPKAIQVMAEVGIDISKQQSKTIDELNKKEFDYVVTICHDVYEKCHIFPGRTRRFHHGFDNPPRLALSVQSEEEVLAIYRRVRDEIKIFVSKLPNILE